MDECQGYAPEFEEGLRQQQAWLSHLRWLGIEVEAPVSIALAESN